MNQKTRIIHAAASRDPLTGALSTPVYHASTFHQSDIDSPPHWDYGRSGNPTREALESLLASLENAQAGFAFASGMAALTAAITAVVKSGDHILATRDIYGGTFRLLTTYLAKFGVAHTFVDTTDPQAVLAALRANTRVLLLESPSNPLLKVTDIAQMAQLARAHSLVSIIDNTFLTPFYQRPLDLGVDISVHSATKFLGGHSDLVSGAVMTNSTEYARAIKGVQNTCGSVLGPGDSWLLIRGIKTLSARMTMQSGSALTLANLLGELPWVTKVYYPGLAAHPGHDLHSRQSTGSGAVISILTDTLERARQIMKRVKIWNVAVSLGGVESILSYPTTMSHAAIPAAQRESLGITNTLIRLSVGLEDSRDLLDDITCAANLSVQ